MNSERILFGALDRAICLVVIVLLAVIAWLNWQMAILCLIFVLAVYAYNNKMERQRRTALRRHFDSIAQGVTRASSYAMQNLPLAMVLIDSTGSLCWSNSVFKDWTTVDLDKTQRLNGILPNFRLEKMWGKSGVFNDSVGDKHFRVIYKFIKNANTVEDGKDGEESYMALYFLDVTDSERAREAAEQALPVYGFLQMDNIEEVTKGCSDVEYTNLWAEINNVIVGEIDKYDGFIRNYAEDSYIFSMSQEALQDMIANNFPLLSRVHNIATSRRIQPTISMGVAAKEPSIKEQTERARSGLEIALGRGGDQACVYIGNEAKFYGGKTQGSEKNTRVRARVVAQAVRELMNESTNILIMGHEREDYDSIGGAIGVAAMARLANMPVHVAVSDQTVAIKKLSTLFKETPDFKNLLVTPEEAEELVDENTLVFVVDVHRPDMVAAPKALQKSKRRVVIDHHRRAPDFIAQPLLTYLEPSSSSTSELVTELIQYFAEKVELNRVEASALYAGIVVDTKNFVVQTGSRTFDAASYLRRSGADLSIVRHLFMETFESVRLRAQMMVSAHREMGLAFTNCPEGVKEAMILSAQTADMLITIEGIEASFVFYELPDDCVGVSARSQGDLNVQVIMEALGGGGHRTVAGGQLKGMSLDEAREAVRQVAIAAMKQFQEEKKKEEAES